MTREKILKYALRGVKEELIDMRNKLNAVLALEPGMANVSPHDKKRIAEALRKDCDSLVSDLHELTNMVSPP